MLTQQRLKELLSYDPETGVFTWIKRRRGVKFGSAAGVISHAIGYRIIGVDGTRYYAHRLAWLHVTGMWPADQIDHVNGERGDNRWNNLREATSSQNKCNSRKRSDNKSGYKGVHLHESGKWRSRIRWRGKITEVGLFASLEEAYRARCDLLACIHKEFARA